MGDWKNILFENDKQISDEELLKYLDDELSKEEKCVLEKKINTPFESDALEGLSQIQNKENLKKHVSQLHLKLQQFTAKRARKPKQEIKIFEWMILALAILLFICVMTFIIINLQNRVPLHTQSFSLIKIFTTLV